MKIFNYFLIFTILSLTVVATTRIPPSSYDYKNIYDLFNVRNLTTDYLTITNPPVQCPAGTRMVFYNGSNSICEEDYGYYDEQNISISVTSGSGTGRINVTLDSLSIIQTTVFPTTGDTNYIFETNADNGLSSIAIPYKVLINDTTFPYMISSSGASYVNFTINNSSRDENFIIRLRWKQ